METGVSSAEATRAISTEGRAEAQGVVAVLLVSTAFFSAFLLFCLEPLVAKMLLPLLGGTPAVWNTCLAFFQTALVAGYAYAHGSIAVLGTRRQALLHLVLVALPLAVMPIHIGAADVASWPSDASPYLRLLTLLTVRAGVPFIALATTAPIVQHWLLHCRRQDSYFLYAASNVGSLLGLFAYSVVFDRALGIRSQSGIWAWGYAGFVALVVCAALVVVRTPAAPAAPLTSRALALPITLRQRARWLLLSAVPAALLVSTTTYLSSEVASFPLLWAVPLALYLGTFIIAFSRRPLVSVARAARLLPLPAAATFLMLSSEARVPVWALFAIHLGAFSLAAMTCHGLLASERPEPAHLTDYFLCVSIGGALGGMMAALAAPLLFRSVLEYPLEILAACLLRPAAEGVRQNRRGDVAWAVGVGVLTAILGLLARYLGLPPTPSAWLAVGVPVLVHYGSLARPLRLALGLGAIFAVSQAGRSPYGRELRSERSFFGVLRATTDPSGNFHQIVHGATVHGAQFIEPAKRREPTFYYSRKGPFGEIFAEVAKDDRVRSVGVSGLGCGGLAPYARAGQEWSFFEIDPAVERMARDPSLFTFLSDAFPGDRGLHIVLGDARLKLAEARPGAFDLLILDAFSSDVIPTHLLVREAMSLYLDKLSSNGLLVMHISNHYFVLEPVVRALTDSFGLSARCWADTEATEEHGVLAKVPTEVCVVARTPERFGSLAASTKWRVPTSNGAPAWTDDRADLLGALRFFGAL
jgi:hypothetical protein